MLKLENVTASYGFANVLHNIDLSIEENEIVALIGANGAGKSTTLKAISGVVKLNSGQILFNDVRIDKLRPEEIVSIGIGHVPEGRRVFPGLTVLENLEVGASGWRGMKSTDLSRDLDRVFEMFPALKPRIKQLAWSMSGGEQQMLAISRALMSRPKLLLMDEPSLGLSPLLVQNLTESIKIIRENGTTILLVEQNAKMAFDLADRAYVLEVGEIALSGYTKDLRTDDRVKAAYLAA